MLLQKTLVHRLDRDVEAEVASVQDEFGMSYARGGQAGVAKQLCAERLDHVRLVLHRVVEHELGKTGILLVLHELVELHGEAGLFKDRAETAHAFKADANIRKHLG